MRNIQFVSHLNHTIFYSIAQSKNSLLDLAKLHIAYLLSNLEKLLTNLSNRATMRTEVVL